MILAFINSNGNGHKIQSEFFPEITDKIQITSIKLFFSKTGINYWKTISYNILMIPIYVYEIVKVMKTINKTKPDKIYNFYEPLSFFFLTFYKGTVVSISNQNTITRETMHTNSIELYTILFLNWLNNYHSSKTISITPFEFKSMNTLNLYRKELETIKTSDKGYVLVYLKYFKKLNLPTDIPIILYTNKKVKKKYRKPNIVYKPLSNDFIYDLANCKYCIGNAGINLITECKILKKELFLLPLHIEQEFNTYYSIKQFGFKRYEN